MEASMPKFEIKQILLESKFKLELEKLFNDIAFKSVSIIVYE